MSFSLTNPIDPSLPSNQSPLFSDISAARGDHLRANNSFIWGNFAEIASYFDTTNPNDSIVGQNLRITDSPIFAELNITGGSGSYKLNLVPASLTQNQTIIIPNITDTIVTLTASQTLTNKTLTKPVISTIINGAYTLTLPSFTDTLATVNKTIAAAGTVVSGNLTIWADTTGKNVSDSGVALSTVCLTSGSNATGTWAISISGTSADANNLSGGSEGSIPYQTAASTTGFLNIGLNGLLLGSNGLTPTWFNPSSLSVNSAVSVSGASQTQITTLPAVTSIGSSGATLANLGNQTIAGTLNATGTIRITSYDLAYTTQGLQLDFVGIPYYFGRIIAGGNTTALGFWTMNGGNVVAGMNISSTGNIRTYQPMIVPYSTAFSLTSVSTIAAILNNYSFSIGTNYKANLIITYHFNAGPYLYDETFIGQNLYVSNNEYIFWGVLFSNTLTSSFGSMTITPSGIYWNNISGGQSNWNGGLNPDVYFTLSL